MNDKSIGALVFSSHQFCSGGGLWTEDLSKVLILELYKDGIDNSVLGLKYAFFLGLYECVHCVLVVSSTT